MKLEIAEFLVALAAAALVHHKNRDSSKINDIHPKEMRLDYDVIIIGAGSAGCAVANRLTENENWNVLLLEAGGDETIVTRTPYLSPILVKSDVDWNYTTTEQKNACRAMAGLCPYTMGKVLGGTSALSDMYYTRGNKDDYDDWCTRYKSPGWCYKDVLPYFIKSENVSAEVMADDKYHGTAGPMNVQYSSFSKPLRQEYIKAAVESGLSEIDYNGKNQNGVGVVQNTMKGKSKMSSAKAFLEPIINRKNLHISKRSEVTKIIFDPSKKKATGIELTRNGKSHRVSALKEIILSAGAINTPKLLMLSGIGPKQHLDSLGIPVVLDLPVGNNLQDHVAAPLFFELDDTSLAVSDDDVFTNEAIEQYVKNGKGPLAYDRAEVMAFTNGQGKKVPDTQLMMLSNSYNYKPESEKDKQRSIVVIAVAFLKTISTGTVRLASNDPKAKPVINPNHLSEENDILGLTQGLEIASKIMETSTMKSHGAKINSMLLPNCANVLSNKSEYLKCVTREYSLSGYNPVGTAKMGPKEDPSAVVSETLLVHGIENLRVADTSVVPTSLRGNTNAPAIMIGEKAADIVKSKYN